MPPKYIIVENTEILWFIIGLIAGVLFIISLAYLMDGLQKKKLNNRLKKVNRAYTNNQKAYQRWIDQQKIIRQNNENQINDGIKILNNRPLTEQVNHNKKEEEASCLPK